MSRDKLIDLITVGIARACVKEANGEQVDKAAEIADVLLENGYRKSSKVVEEIFEEIEKVLKRKTARSRPQFEKLKNRGEEFLSEYGYEQMGYFKGIMSTCADLQDLIDELKKKDTEGEE